MNGANDENGGSRDVRIAAAREQLDAAERSLRAAKAAWDDDGFLEALAQKPREEREAAFRQKLEIGEKLLAIQNARFELIVSQVRDNAEELQTAVGEVHESLGRLQNVDRVLTAVSSLLSIVKRVLVVV